MRILIPVDGSTCSRAAVRFIGARSKFMGEKPDVTLLNVQQNIPGTVIEHFSLEAVRSVYEAEGKAIVEKLAPEIEASALNRIWRCVLTTADQLSPKSQSTTILT